MKSKPLGMISFPHELLEVVVPLERLQSAPTGIAWQAYRRSTHIPVTVHLLPRTKGLEARIAELRTEIAYRRKLALAGYVTPFEVGLAGVWMYFITTELRGQCVLQSMQERFGTAEQILQVAATACRIIASLRDEGLSHGGIDETTIIHDGCAVQVVDLCYQRVHDGNKDDLHAIAGLTTKWLSAAGALESTEPSTKWLLEQLGPAGHVTEARLAARCLLAESKGGTIGLPLRRRVAFQFASSALIVAMTLGGMVVAAGL